MLLLTSDCSGHLVTARASDSMFCIDFVRVTNCFYDYDYDKMFVKNKAKVTSGVNNCVERSCVCSSLRAYVYVRREEIQF